MTRPMIGVSSPAKALIRLMMPNTLACWRSSTSSMRSRLHDTATIRPLALRKAASANAAKLCAKAQTTIGRLHEIKSQIRVVRRRPSRLVIGAASS